MAAHHHQMAQSAPNHRLSPEVALHGPCSSIVVHVAHTHKHVEHAAAGVLERRGGKGGRPLVLRAAAIPVMIPNTRSEGCNQGV